VSYSLGPVLPHVRRAAELVGALYGVETVLGWRASAVDKMGHPAGRALDFMCSRAQGDKINAYLLANADALGIQYTIWRQTYYEPGKAPSRMADRGSPTANHEDHVHANFTVRAGSGAVSADFAGVEAAADVDAAGPFDGWAGDVLGLGLKLGATVAALALVVTGLRSTVQN
jgi:hypothetical protein